MREREIEREKEQSKQWDRRRENEREKKVSEADIEIVGVACDKCDEWDGKIKRKKH